MWLLALLPLTALLAPPARTRAAVAYLPTLAPAWMRVESVLSAASVAAKVSKADNVAAPEHVPQRQKSVLGGSR